MLTDIKKSFTISPWLFLVPVIVIGLIIKKTEPLIALLIGTLLGGIFAIIFQPEIVLMLSGGNKMSFLTVIKESLMPLQ